MRKEVRKLAWQVIEVTAVYRSVMRVGCERDKLISFKEPLSSSLVESTRNVGQGHDLESSSASGIALWCIGLYKKNYDKIPQKNLKPTGRGKLLQQLQKKMLDNIDRSLISYLRRFSQFSSSVQRVRVTVLWSREIKLSCNIMYLQTLELLWRQSISVCSVL